MFAFKQNISILCTTVAALTILWSCGTTPAEYLVIDGEALGTFVQVKCSDEATSDQVVNLIKRVDKEAKASMSIFDNESLLSRLNRNATDSLDYHIERVLRLAEGFTELSGGAYDVTIKPLTEAWGFAGKSNNGTSPNVDSLLTFVGMEKIAICDGRLIKEDYRTQLDFNSIAKGYVVDLIAEELGSMGVKNYMVNIGGEIRCHGLNARGGRWSIGIETPYDGNMAMADYEKIIHVEECGVATSGNYRRYYLTGDGRKVAHTIDPRSGYSAVSDLLSVTVIAPTCAEADAAATMFLSMGSEGGALELAQRCESEFGWNYYFIYASGEKYRIECSERFK